MFHEWITVMGPSLAVHRTILLVTIYLGVCASVRLLDEYVVAASSSMPRHSKVSTNCIDRRTLGLLFTQQKMHHETKVHPRIQDGLFLG